MMVQRVSTSTSIELTYILTSGITPGNSSCREEHRGEMRNDYNAMTVTVNCQIFSQQIFSLCSISTTHVSVVTC